MQEITQNINLVRNKIAQAAHKSGQKAEDIILVAVTKTVDIAAVQKAMQLGLNNFGENRVQELNHKILEIPNAKWHMIGRLQTNKVKDVVGKVDLIHSLDRWNLAKSIDKRAELNDIVVPTLLQVNVSGEKQKAGISPDDIKEFLGSISALPRLQILGFMTMAPEDPDPERARPFFKELSLLRDKLSKEKYANVDLKYLSMGMSQDYQVAIEEGANVVRIGSSIFGKR